MLYIASVTQGRDVEEAKIYLERKRSKGKGRGGARRSHKRQLASRIIRRMWRDEKARSGPCTLAA